MSTKLIPLLALFFCAIPLSASAIIRCEMNGKPVNPNNGFETATLTGMLRCKDEDSGKLQREEELRDGKYIGLHRTYDRDGKLASERSVNERGNSQGVEKQFWPSGQLKSESTADNGQTLGVSRRYFENGNIERIGFIQERRAVVEINFNPDGSYADLRCPPASIIAEDRKPCGFNGKIETVLYTTKAKRRALQTLDQGKLLAATTYADDGSVSNELSFDQGRRRHRGYNTQGSADGKSVLREERIYEPDELPLNATAGRLQSSKLWAASGQATEQIVYTDGKPTQTDRWYLNGALKEKSTVAGTGDTARTQRERFNDDGKIASRETLTSTGTAIGLQQYFHGNGKLRTETTYGDADARGRTRVIARKAWDESGKLIADDEVLEDGSRKRKL